MARPINKYTGRPHSHNWKGGSVASNGYKLIFVGKDHHLADVRGYAYEHRLVAEESRSEPLKDGELVHHEDEVRTNNSPENLKVKTSNAEHFLSHRKKDRGLRLPGELNITIACACGCGERFYKFDESGRPRVFVSGHNDHPSPTLDAVSSCMIDGPKKVSEICRMTNMKQENVSTALCRLKSKNIVFRVSQSTWSLRQSDAKDRD